MSTGTMRTGTGVRESQGYSTQPADLHADRGRILALWREGLGQNGKPEAKYEWYYARHPNGAPRVFFLCHEDATEPVGVATISTRMLHDGDRTHVAGFLADFVVNRDHRSFFPALFLQREIRRRGLGTFPVLFGIPNAQSEAIVKRVGYRRVGELVRYVLVVRSAAYLSRRMPGWAARLLGAFIDPMLRLRDQAGSSVLRTLRVEWRDATDARFDELWQRALGWGFIMGERGARFLQWRCASSPFGAHRFLTIVQGGVLHAYAACRVEDDALAVLDFMWDPSQPRAGQALWGALSREASQRKLSRLSVACLAPAAMRAALESAGLVARERQPLYAAFADAALESTAPRWFVTAADEDA